LNNRTDQPRSPARHIQISIASFDRRDVHATIPETLPQRVSSSVRIGTKANADHAGDSRRAPHPTAMEIAGCPATFAFRYTQLPHCSPLSSR
jgi:hypothetical protein